MSRLACLELAVDICGPVLRDKDLTSRKEMVIDMANSLLQYLNQDQLAEAIDGSSIVDQDRPRRGRPKKLAAAG